jgi:NADPH-dependent glutamate synthase beta subunit-like oxidoreductase/2,4-dienoyl-CoA reductase-like NADH-dependent reductase (Old Yellow Enzyme family)
VAEYRRLVAETRRAAREAHGREPVLIVQLTHSGRYGKPTGIPKPMIAHRSPVLDPRHKLPADYPVVTDEYLDRLQELFVEAAQLAAEAGFDGVDVKSCHRYLVSELLASFTREGRYGGSFENRTRFLLETLRRIRDHVPGVFIATRMNAYDAIPHPYGFGVSVADFRVPDLTEPVRLARELAALGVPVLNVSIGNPYYNPHYGRPFDFPIQGMTVPEEHPLEAIVRFAGVTRALQEAVPAVPVIASGYAWLRHLMPPVAAGLIRARWAGLVGQGRGAFAYPDSVQDVLREGRMDPAKCCVTCSACTQIMRDGGMTGCVVRDSEIYGPQYRQARRFALDRLQEEARRCRSCEQATCQAACPAHVDVPAFLQAFAEGDVRRSYDLLRRSNALPEMCGFVCPSEVQCEGACLENIFCEHAVPIQDIQLEVCRIARREGYAGLPLPEKALSARAAIVGGGPAGIACAIRLLEKGWRVTLFDRARRLGGTPDEIIPAFRYGEAGDEINAILGPAVKAGRLELKLGAALGKDLELGALRREFDAVFLGMGLGGSSRLGEAGGVFDATTFLADVKAGRRRTLPASVAVLGGGNTAMDAAATAKQLGARDVYLVYRRSLAEMPAWPAERDRVIRAGVHILILTQPLGYEKDAQSRVTGVRVARTELGEPDASGRRKPRAVPGSESVLACGLVVEALGQGVPDDLREALAGVAFTKEGLVETKPHSTATALAGVYAGGDLVNGGTTAVKAVADGQCAADEMDAARRTTGLRRGP